VCFSARCVVERRAKKGENGKEQDLRKEKEEKVASASFALIQVISRASNRAGKS